MSRDAVILINLGTPESPTPSGVRRFLREFLSDRRVVEVPRLIWWPILHGFILPFRPNRVAKAYQSIWTPEGSPLKVYTERLAEKLHESLIEAMADKAPKVFCAYTYGKPSIEQQISQLQGEGVQRILLLPLYPQYSATTTGSIYDQYAALIQRSRDVPDVRIQKFYYHRQDYTAALVQSVQAHWAKHSQAQKLLFSFHGIPKRNVELGDPYQRHCLATAKSVAEALNLPKDRWAVSFQSRLGKAEWLKPYTDVVLSEWPKQGINSVDVICPAFAIDCLETLEEIDEENRELFLASGGSEYRYIPCLNDDPAQVFLFSNIALEHFA
ncbi:ferrochelatase [Simiduia sp. 21SJ11W-1]|uniref:ferrochelatase n=1 Tax=Simiduia sp. 21SJ11W-1 TaxID=2909669 RepID=UPI0020A150EB|nr:ferrochelatase [Simiduia sp. 21SJ11W-1]UTA49414.1 ferrochelatase [Simiduia sp. 21SJ11W-1]